MTSRWNPGVIRAIYILVCGAAGIVLAPHGSMAQSQAPTREGAAIEALRTSAGDGFEFRRSNRGSVAVFLGTQRGEAIATGEIASASAERRARAFLRLHGVAVGVEDSSRFELTLTPRPDALGMERVRLQQRHRGLRVRGAEISVHLRGAGVVAVSGRTVADPVDLDISPTVPPSQALWIVNALMAEVYGVSAADLSAPELEIFNAGLFHGIDAPTRLAWHIQASFEALRVEVWVDAHDEAVLLHFNSLPEALNRLVYDTGNTSNVPGTLARSEGQAPTGTEPVDTVYDYLEDTYQYYLNEHGRDSYDGAGATMQASVGYCSTSSACTLTCPCSNAFWFGSYAVFGLLDDDDIVGHEFTHGVVESTASLVYLNQSGALNESYADIFGESIDLTNGAGLDTPEVRWLISEDILPATGIRNMANPNLSFLTPDPGKMSDPQVACTTDDSGGVHTNSGIGNHAFVLMVDGGFYNGYAVNGIGMTKAGKIQYRALSTYLLANSTFSDNYDALRQACDDLIGTSGIDASDCTEVRRAAEAVEMNLPWACNCGNSTLDAGEECDDGNRFPLDGCSVLCLTEQQVPSTGMHGWVVLVAIIGGLGLTLLVGGRSARPLSPS
ncbi:MAG: M4 family metallopeptidase [Deltaproteobacteria bacterium]|nr:M4 family metallopeptidase [Deltaproteobacteria bacterium]MBW2387980.1 M4 family metallopeptidase [Deltaproteobacteria bacterium]